MFLTHHVIILQTAQRCHRRPTSGALRIILVDIYVAILNHMLKIKKGDVVRDSDVVQRTSL